MAKGGRRPGAGRPKGTTDKRIKLVREFFVDLLHDRKQQILDDLDSLEPKDRLMILEKFAKYVLPQKMEMETNGEPVQFVLQLPEKHEMPEVE